MESGDAPVVVSVDAAAAEVTQTGEDGRANSEDGDRGRFGDIAAGGGGNGEGTLWAFLPLAFLAALCAVLRRRNLARERC